jgi:uncharacterized membrane protein required for colicin V production
MVLDVGIIVILAGSAFHGYRQGLTRGVASLFTLVTSILVAVQSCDDLARLFMSNASIAPVLTVVCFVVVLGVEWGVLYSLHRLFGSLLRHHEQDWLDQFLGGVTGFGRGLATAWLGIAAFVGAFPQTAGAVASSRASMRLLAVSGMPAGHEDELPSAEAARDSLDMKCAVSLHGPNLRAYSVGN